MDEYQLTSAETKGDDWLFCWESPDGIKLEQCLDKETLEGLAAEHGVTIAEAAWAFIEDCIELHQQEQAQAGEAAAA